jgi:hypothetical protein
MKALAIMHTVQTIYACFAVCVGYVDNNVQSADIDAGADVICFL